MKGSMTGPIERTDTQLLTDVVAQLHGWLWELDPHFRPRLTSYLTLPDDEQVRLLALLGES